MSLEPAAVISDLKLPSLSPVNVLVEVVAPV